MKILIDKIMLDGGTQARVKLNIAAIADYADAMKNDIPFPPIDLFFDGEHYWIGDGFHRCRGALEAGLKEIESAVYDGTKEDALWFAIGANKAHGLRRDKPDIENCIKIGLNHKNGVTKSNVQLGKHIGVSEGTIRNYRKKLEDRKEIPKSNKREGTDGRIFSIEDIHDNGETSKITKFTRNEVTDYPTSPRSNEEIEQDEIEYKNPPSYTRKSYIHHGDGTTEEVPAIPDDPHLRQVALDFATQEIEAGNSLTAQQWEAMKDEYIGDCFKQCYGPAKLVKGHVLEFGVRGVYVCSKCGYAYPPFCEPVEVTLEDHIRNSVLNDVDEGEWAIKHWREQFGGMAGHPFEIAREVWLKEMEGVSSLQRGVFIDPVIAEAKHIAKAIDYLSECYRRKIGQWYFEEKPIGQLFDLNNNASK